MLTVIRDIASTANNNHERSPDILEFWQLLCQTANKSVIDTPSLLPVLSEAGVVDAGAFGLAVLLEGGLNALTEYPLTMTMNDSISVSSIRTSTDQTTSISREFIHSRGEESFGYCTQFIIEGDNLTIDSIRTDLIDLGVSNVVMGTESIIRIHSHSEDPGRLLSYGISIGQLSQINISNMNEQNKDFLYSEQNPIDPIKLAIIAVASGDGITNLFLNSGVAGIVSGGESMNPSIGEILDCVNGINADRIVILPNNPNIIPAANQVVSLSKIPISVIPTTTIPQGISAILSFNPLIETEMNIEAMNNSISNVRSGAICRAAKSTHINNIDIEVGQFIGLLEREVVVVGKGTSETLIGLIEHMEPEKDSIITLYWGNDMLEAEAQSYLQVTADLYPGLDIDLVQGGQDYYDFIISVE
jgi:DAK2 domain fusion protein YloV